MNERVIRKLDSTKLTFKKLSEGRIEVVGFGVGDEADAKITLSAAQAFQVRHQDGQLALVLQDFKRTPEQLNEDAQRDLDAHACYDLLTVCGELGGRQPAEGHVDYLRRIIDAVIVAQDQAELERRLTEQNLRSPIRQTHTYVTMELSAAAYQEIADKMRAAEYDHAFNEEGEIDMHGLAVVNSMPKLAARDVISVSDVDRAKAALEANDDSIYGGPSFGGR
jgi:hypothetical protein